MRRKLHGGLCCRGATLLQVLIVQQQNLLRGPVTPSPRTSRIYDQFRLAATTAFAQCVQTKAFRIPVANKLTVARVGLRLLSELPATPIANDKNSGYSLVTDTDLSSDVSEILGTDRYEVFTGDYSAYIESQSYCKARVLSAKVASLSGGAQEV